MRQDDNDMKFITWKCQATSKLSSNGKSENEYVDVVRFLRWSSIAITDTHDGNYELSVLRHVTGEYQLNLFWKGKIVGRPIPFYVETGRLWHYIPHVTRITFASKLCDGGRKIWQNKTRDALHTFGNHKGQTQQWSFAKGTRSQVPTKITKYHNELPCGTS